MNKQTKNFEFLKEVQAFSELNDLSVLICITMDDQGGTYFHSILDYENKDLLLKVMRSMIESLEEGMPHFNIHDKIDP